MNWALLPRKFRQAVGCPKCGQTGYRGRMGAVEVLDVTPEIAHALGNGAGEKQLQAIAVGQGMATMAADGIEKAANGLTTLEEVIRVMATT